MKTTIKALFVIITLIINLILTSFNTTAQSVGINATGTAPDKSALLDLSSTDKGFLITRADTASIASPAFGLMTLAPIDSCLYLFNGNKWMGMGGGGSYCSCNCSDTTPYVPCGVDTITAIEDVTSLTGEIWMDRNLGASQVATSSDDAAAFGDLYQWGRCSDGHEKRNSETTTTLSATDTPGHSNFILESSLPSDWRNPANDNLWQGVAGINNPCPTGYRIPTEVELDDEQKSWGSNDTAGAYGSPLKLTVAGYRNLSLGHISYPGENAYYWSSTIDGTESRYLSFYSTYGYMTTYHRTRGNSVRCIKD